MTTMNKRNIIDYGLIGSGLLSFLTGLFIIVGKDQVKLFNEAKIKRLSMATILIGAATLLLGLDDYLRPEITEEGDED